MIEAFKYRLPVSYFLRIQGLDLVLTDGAHVAGSSQEFCPAMRIRDQAIGHTVEPLQAVGQGRALDITLDADALQKSGYLEQYFAPPTVLATLNTDEITKTTTSFPVDDASGFEAGGGTAYWGLEKLVYGSRTSAGATQTLNSVTRDSAGTAFNYAQNSPRGLSGVWSVISDRPLLWTGRLVELWAVATNPEGELLGAPFDASSPTSAETRLWVGYISEQPTITTTGITIRALPAERLADREFVHGRVFKTTFVNNPHYGHWLEYVYWPKGQMIEFHLNEAGTLRKSIVDPIHAMHGSSLNENDPLRVERPFELLNACVASWESDLSSQTGDTITIDISVDPTENDNPDGPYMILSAESSANNLEDLAIFPGYVGHFFMYKGASITYGGLFGLDVVGITRKMAPPILWSVANTLGFPITDPISSADSIFGGIPTVGQALSWEQNAFGITRTFLGLVTAVIDTSALGGTDAQYWIRIDPNTTFGIDHSSTDQNITDVGELTEALIVSGVADSEGATALTLGNLWLQLLCSSGSGSKSATYDTLPHGQGAGIPEAWIAFSSSTFQQFAAVQQFEAFGELEAQAIFLDALAAERAFSQTLTSNLAKVDAVDVTQPTEGETLVALTPSDLLSEPIQAGLVAAVPNVVTFEFINSAHPKIIHRDTLRIASEGGVNSLDLEVPASWYFDSTGNQAGGITKLGALANSILRGPFFGHVYLFTLSLSSEHWEAVNVGDAVEVTGEHYAWVNLAATSSPGHRAGSVKGRCMSKECKLDGSGMTITMAVWPAAGPQVYSPDSAFTVSSLTITLPAGRAGWFWDDERDDVTFYKPGEEDSKLETKEMQSSAGNDITFGSLPSWVGESGVRVTFAPTASASDRQKKWGHVSDGGVML